MNIQNDIRRSDISLGSEFPLGLSLWRWIKLNSIYALFYMHSLNKDQNNMIEELSAYQVRGENLIKINLFISGLSNYHHLQNN